MAKATSETPSKVVKRKSTKPEKAEKTAKDNKRKNASVDEIEEGKHAEEEKETQKELKKAKRGKRVEVQAEGNHVEENEMPKESKKTKRRKRVEPQTEERGQVEKEEAKEMQKELKKTKKGKHVEIEEEEREHVEEEETQKESKKPKKGKRVQVQEDIEQVSKKTRKEKHIEAQEETEVQEEQPEPEFFGFSSDDDDSSDDDEVPDEIPGIDVGKLPTIAKDDATVKRKLEKAKRKPTGDHGVIYLGRIPHGFYEDQMRAYFSQFGTVTRLRLSRNKKTGRSKHYAFIEFDSSSVAKIVADTMDNYLLMGHILTCKVIPKDEVHPELWIGANRKWRVVPRDRIARVHHNKPRTEEEQEKAEQRLLKRQSQRKRKLEEAGIKYDFEAVSYKKRSKPTEA
ncbi:hypothetical protein A0H81_07703 [Grifola frondosa]|uniref:RRM domain-containing protein n=1 Tax=Grifola frondosa TaxID=5627 RepID=A0A1C7MCI2_GRIFR|nr:hypothetical protein A0H81_07703 [Grifola frondosa]